MQFPVLLLPLVVRLADPTNQQPPDDNDVVAGWTAFGVFLLMALAVAFLGWSLSRQFKKVRAAREAGVFGEDDKPAERSSSEENHQQPQA
jgi:hypothetical protein